jgi:diketogulonate reductase-like aldo/keto reductase
MLVDLVPHPRGGPAAVAGLLQRDLIVLPKSKHRERIEHNAQVFDFELSDEDVAALDALDRTGGADRSLERPWW